MDLDVIPFKRNPEMDHNYVKILPSSGTFMHEWKFGNYRLNLFDCSVKNFEKYMCYRCTFKTNLLIELKKHHQDGHMPQNVQVMYNCNKKQYQDGHNLTMSRNVQVLSVYNCSICNFETNSMFVFMLHQNSSKCLANRQNQEFQCEVEDYLRKHFKSFSNEQWLKCSRCRFKARLVANLKRHYIYNHGNINEDRWFQCGQCLYKNKEEDNLKKHILKNHENCSHLFRRKYCASQVKKLTTRLESNFVILNKVKWFYCTSCSYKTSRSSNLRNHIISKHLEIDKIKGFQCKLSHFKTEPKFQLVQQILSKHTKQDEHQFTCALCPYKARAKYYVDRHFMMTHNPEKVGLLQCKQCPTRVFSKSDLKQHVIFQHLKPIQCLGRPFYPVKLKRFYALDTHLKAGHFISQ